MSVSPADPNRSPPPRRADAETGQQKSVDAVGAKRRDASRVSHTAHDQQQADFERALERAGNEDASDDEVKSVATPEPLSAPPQRFVARVQPGDGPSPTADSRVAPGLRTQDVTLLRQTALPLVADNATQRLQLEFANASIPLQRIDLERTHSGHVDVAVTTTHIRGPLDACVDRLRTRLAERGTALGHLHVEPPDANDETSD